MSRGLHQEEDRQIQRSGRIDEVDGIWGIVMPKLTEPEHEMNIYHRINVWRIARKCPVCGSSRGYSQANPGGLEFNCIDTENCAFNEFVPTATIHAGGEKTDATRYEVLDQDNNVRPGWGYTMKKSDKLTANARRKKYGYRKVLYP
jgi:hypothetical protein